MICGKTTFRLYHVLGTCWRGINPFIRILPYVAKSVSYSGGTGIECERRKMFFESVNNRNGPNRIEYANKKGAFIMPGHHEKRYRKTLYIVTSAAIAAIYVILTLPFAQIAFGPVQFRLAECMTVLPILMPAAIPGLTIGCFLSNLLNSNNLGPIDIIFGSLATLLAAVSTRWIFVSMKRVTGIAKDWIALLPPVILNALIVGTYLTFLLTTGPVLGTVILMNIGYIALSQAVVIYLIGFPLLLLLRKSGVGKYREGTGKK